MGERVSIDPAGAIRLSRACLDASVHLRRETEILLVQLREAGEDPGALGSALQASEWAAAGTRRIAAVIEAVATWSTFPPGACPAGWSSPAGRVDDAGASASAAAEALTALHDGNLDRLMELARDWADNPNFAVAFGSRLDIADLVPWLVLGAEPGADVSFLDDGHTTVLDLVGVLATALSAATTAGTERFSLHELLEAGATDGLTPVGAAMLFAAPGGPDRSWSTRWLVDATSLVVVPLTAQMRTGDHRLVARQWGDDVVDLRTPILDALTRDPAGARAAFAAVDLRELVGASASYLDYGASLAAALEVATRPDGSDRGGAALVMTRLVDALSAEDPPPLRLADRLGSIAWPWIGAFRLDRADRRVGGLPSPLPDPDEDGLRRYVKLSSASPQATADLLGALDVWLAFQLAASGAEPASPQVLHDLGAVSRFVSEASRDAARSHGAAVDADRDAYRDLFELAGNGVGALVGRWWGDAGEFAISNVITPLVIEPRVLPELDAEIEQLASVPASVARDQELLEWQVLAHLWRRRAESGLFERLPPPPPVVVDPSGQLAPVATFDEAAWVAYRAWRDLVADPTGLDNVGAAFARDLAPSSEGGG